ncbi:MAG TPA: hypothetical protein VFW96_16210 [Thermomicrobiales bacterium]|nr:hypothetical protein [Thermomicrobiales bacterium]
MRALIVRLRYALALAGLAIVLSVSGAAAAGAIHGSFDPTGAVFTCTTPTGIVTYTITSGTVDVVMHQEFTPNGRASSTGTMTANHVFALGSDGNDVRIVGADWFGGAGTEDGFVFTATSKFQLVALNGGVLGSVNETVHMSTRTGQVFDHNVGNCTEPPD